MLMASTLSLSNSIWCTISETSTLLGGPTSVVTIKSVEPSFSSNIELAIAFSCHGTCFTRDSSRSGDWPVIPGRVISAHFIQLLQSLQALVNQDPGAVHIFISLAFTVFGARTGAIEYTFSASCNRADAGSVFQSAVPAGGAALVPDSRFFGHAHERGIDTGQHRHIRETLGYGLHTDSATER